MSFRHLDRNYNTWQELTLDLQNQLKYGYYQDFHTPSWAEHQKQIMDIYNIFIDSNL